MRVRASAFGFVSGYIRIYISMLGLLFYHLDLFRPVVFDLKLIWSWLILSAVPVFFVGLVEDQVV